MQRIGQAPTKQIFLFKASRLHLLADTGQRRRVWVDDTEIALSSREGLLLEQLVRQANQVVTARELALVTHNLLVLASTP